MFFESFVIIFKRKHYNSVPSQFQIKIENTKLHEDPDVDETRKKRSLMKMECL